MQERSVAGLTTIRVGAKQRSEIEDLQNEDLKGGQIMSNSVIATFIQNGHITIVKEKTVIFVDENGRAIEIPNIKYWLEDTEDDEK